MPFARLLGPKEQEHKAQLVQPFLAFDLKYKIDKGCTFVKVGRQNGGEGKRSIWQIRIQALKSAL